MIASRFPSVLARARRGLSTAPGRTLDRRSEPLPACVAAGMRVMRMNFSHATFDEAMLRLTNIRAAPGQHARALSGARPDLSGSANLRATLLDTRGPEIRMGGLQVTKDTGDRKAKITMTTGDEA